MEQSWPWQSYPFPHLAGTVARFVHLRKQLDRRIFLNFGILSAVGGLAGALLNAYANSPALAIVFGGLLVFAAVSGLTGLAERMHFGRRTVWLAGALSGFLAGWSAIKVAFARPRFWASISGKKRSSPLLRPLRWLWMALVCPSISPSREKK